MLVRSRSILVKPNSLGLPLPRCSTFLSSHPIITRMVHSTPKQDHTTLLSNDRLANFNVMSLKALKSECRTRGLRVSGRKGDLVDRILAYESSGALAGNNNMSSIRQFHVSKSTKSKGDVRPVDAVSMPDIAATEESLETLDKEYIVHITPLSDSADQRPVTKVEKELDAAKNDTGIVSPSVSTTDHEKVIFQADSALESFEVVNEEAELDSDKESYQNKRQESSAGEELSSRDRIFLLSFAAVVASWWSLKVLGKGKSKQS